MDIEFEIEARAEQWEGAEPAPAPAPRGRPWVKGQSGNPAGRPRQTHTTGIVADYLIGRKTIPLTKKLVALALAGDRTALRLCLERIAPPRLAPPPPPARSSPPVRATPALPRRNPRRADGRRARPRSSSR